MRGLSDGQSGKPHCSRSALSRVASESVHQVVEVNVFITELPLRAQVQPPALLV